MTRHVLTQRDVGGGADCDSGALSPPLWTCFDLATQAQWCVRSVYVNMSCLVLSTMRQRDRTASFLPSSCVFCADIVCVYVRVDACVVCLSCAAMRLATSADGALRRSTASVRAQNAVFASFSYANDRFTTAGSGQTQQ